MRMFTALKAKGVCRPITQEFQLASEYHDNDMLSAEFFRTCEHVPIHGRDYVARVEHVSKDPAATFDSDSKIQAPTRQRIARPIDWVTLYGYQPKVANTWYLSVQEFWSVYSVHRLH